MTRLFCFQLRSRYGGKERTSERKIRKLKDLENRGREKKKRGNVEEEKEAENNRGGERGRERK
jgi:hypothetical protein